MVRIYLVNNLMSYYAVLLGVVSNSSGDRNSTARRSPPSVDGTE